jgi:hypothetical protein
VRRLASATGLLAGVLLVVGCTSQDPNSAAASPSPDAPAGTPAGGTPAQPVVLTPTDALLDWQPVPGSTDLTVTTNGTWTLTLDESNGRAELTGPVSTTTPAGVKGKVSDALLSDDWALVVHQDPQEQDPATAVATNLTDGSTTILDGSTAGAPTRSGGSWALDGDRATYPTDGPDGAYCLATADLPTGQASVVWCAPARTGFNGVRLGASGGAMLTFDDAQPACRTVVTVSTAGTTPFDGVTPCKGFEGLVTADGAVWTVVPKENQIDAVEVYARIGDGYYDLGAGTSGTLTACAGATYFSQDAADDGGSARLMRWADGALTTAYVSKPGQAFLSAPRCAGDVLSLSSFSQQGDEQVSATLG